MFNTQSRIASIRSAQCLTGLISGMSTFDLSTLEVDQNIDFALSNNLRLGHLAEQVVSGLIKASSNYKVLLENIQLFEEQRTVGELDFIIEEVASGKVIHMELAYKFYLYDPCIAGGDINKWIGPNRNDSLVQKLDKLTTKQFLLLYHESVQSKLKEINVNDISQELCLLSSLFLPYKYSGSIDPLFTKAIQGYHMDFKTFVELNTNSKSYYIAPKHKWGMDPSLHKKWESITEVGAFLETCMKEKQAQLCWQRHNDSFESFFITWW